jgi:hypothetical protein
LREKKCKFFKANTAFLYNRAVGVGTGTYKDPRYLHKEVQVPMQVVGKSQGTNSNLISFSKAAIDQISR